LKLKKGDRTLVGPYGLFTPHYNPTLCFPNGHNYFLKKWGFWTTDHTWLAADDTALVTFRRAFAIWSRIWGEVEVHPSAAALPELDLLITLALYLAVTPVDSGGGG
jgi:hypothetical protein